MEHGIKLERKNRGYGKQSFGKYRGKVTNVSDPQKMGRVKAECPKIFGIGGETDWAAPCLPPGFKTLPKVGDFIWLEFEDGDIKKPIWSGVWFLEGGYTVEGIRLDAPDDEPIKLEGRDVLDELDDIKADIVTLQGMAHTH